MKITDVRAVQPAADGSPLDWRTSLGQILVAVDTDVGLTGYGVGGGGPAGIHVIRTVLRDRLVGRDPEQIEELNTEMYHVTLPFGRKGIAIMAQSGVDLALWDLRGKAAGRPVAELLGGRVGEPIPVYITVWNDLTDELAASYRAFKLHVEHREEGGTVDAVAVSVEAARRVVGPEPELMIDAWMRWDVQTTLAVAEATEEFRLSWIEEPLPADDFDGYALLCKKSRVPIAGGEHEFTAGGFKELIERKLHHVLQPDACWCGGMTDLVRIYEMAKQAGLRVCPHRGSELWGLHAIAALDPNPLAESGRPWMTWVQGQPPVIDGCVRLSDAAGFGVEIDEENLEILD